MIGGFRSRLKRWQGAGLISEGQAQSIIAFEKERRQGKLVRDLSLVGVFAIGLGILSIVAANWRFIPAEAKIGLHVLLNGAVIFFMLRAKNPLVKDGLVAGLFFLFLTFIALIGQIYQLHGDLPATIFFWTLICAPFVWFYGRGHIAAMPWTAAALTAFVLNIGDWVTEERWLFFTLSATGFALPLLCLLLGRWLRTAKEGFAHVFHHLGLYLPALLATAATFLFYFGERLAAHHTLLLGLMGACLLAAFVIFRPRGRDDEEGKILWSYLMVSGLVGLAPFGLASVESDLLAALLFIFYWGFLAFLGARIPSGTLTDWAIRLIVLRLFIVYTEIFGSLLLNGAGLIISGVLLLVVLRNLNKITAFGRRLVNHEF